jgi:hypothetical protein
MIEKKAKIVPPVPEPNERPSDYHQRHLRYDRPTDGRCRICFPNAKA